MKISTAIARLEAVQRLFGDIDIIGGYLTGKSPLRHIWVIDADGVEIWPRESCHRPASPVIGGVFLD